MKTCTSCGKRLALTKFHKHGTSKDGRQTVCRVCQVRNRRERLEARRIEQETITELMMRWR